MQNEDMADKEPATKGYLKSEIRRVDQDIKRVIHHVDKRFAAVDKRFDEIAEAIKRSHSILLERIDRFMTKTRKVDVDNTFLIHRMDKVEKRLDALESRAS